MVLTRTVGLLATLALLFGANARAQPRGGFQGGRQPLKGAAKLNKFGSQGGEPLANFGGQAGGPRRLLFGFALECTRCQPTNRRGGFVPGPLAVWHYDEFPHVAAVVGGSPAERAGIRTGDLLLDVNGASLLTSDGAERFSALRGGDVVTLTLERGGKSYNATVTLGRMASLGRGGPLGNSPQASQFSGRVGATAVDVVSDVPVLSTTDSSGVMTLRVGSTTIRLRPTASKAP
jgi:membrane-associated protease RseP (regulator of RpoE activity)